jgi:dihydrofolate synthase/folylpolyglutamate synthase
VGIALSDYRRALDYLFARTTGESRLGLERTDALLRRLGEPHRRFRSFHIAGTNGKGSVAATLEAFLRAGGHRVAKYTSPHLVDFRERLLVDGHPVDAGEIVGWIERWTPGIERIGATFFEATTAMAFDLFARAGAEVAVIETGLGGRLDATNVIRPVVAGVTMIGIDHTEFLGTTREEIAREKAGIFKPGIAAVIGEPDRSIATELAGCASAARATPIIVVRDAFSIAEVGVSASGTVFDLRSTDGRRGSDGGWVPPRRELSRLVMPLVGRYQASNATTAIAMVDAAGPEFALAGEQLREALRQVRIPGRFHRVGKVIFDVAHNPDGAEVLAETVRAVAPARPVIALVTVLGDKDWRGIISALRPVVDRIILSTAPTAPASRRWDLQSVDRELRGTRSPIETIADFDAALERALSLGETVVITGSFHTVGDAMARLQVDPLAG